MGRSENRNFPKSRPIAIKLGRLVTLEIIELLFRLCLSTVGVEVRPICWRRDSYRWTEHNFIWDEWIELVPLELSMTC